MSESTYAFVEAGYDLTAAVDKDTRDLVSWPWNFDVPGPIQAATSYFETCWLFDDAHVGCGLNVPPDGEFVAISTNMLHVCGVRVGGSVECWGDDYYGSGVLEPPAGTSFVTLATGATFGCALEQSGTVQCWGDVSYHNNLVPPEDVAFARLDAGGGEICGIRVDDGGVQCWGWDGDLQHEPEGRFVDVSVEFNTACAVTESHEIVCWGRPIGGAGPPDGAFMSVSVGVDHVCALAVDGHVWCWGGQSVDEDVIAPP